MKRVLLSIGVAFSLLVFYLLITSVIVILYDFDREVILLVQIPVRVPQIVFYYFYPPLAEDYQMEMTQRKIILGASVFAANVLLYSIPVYFVLRLAAKYRKTKSLPSAEPPPPPTF